jgi:hypothetical protein
LQPCTCPSRQQRGRGKDQAILDWKIQWLFANTVNGAKASALLFSLVESAKANNINPED